MGCDIHAYLEYRINNSWDCFCKEIDLERNYQLFSSLAGIRGNGKCIINPKGIPDDLSPDVFMDYNVWIDEKEIYVVDGQWHDPGWLSVEEYLLIWNTHIDNRFPLSANWELLGNILQLLSGKYGINNVRLVFWFDN